MRVLIAGCGYLGLHLGRELVQQGHSVVGLRRSPDAAADLTAAGIEYHAADLTQAGFAMPKGPWDGVVFAASPGRQGDSTAYRALYLDGLANLLRELAAAPPKRFVYVGSTAVYGQTDGSIVKENSPTEPGSATGRILLEAEALVTAAVRNQVPGVVLRTAGIYGPDRLHLLHRFIRNEVRITGQGLRHLNMIHRDDAAAAVITALRNGRPGEVYNLVDQEPVTEIHFYTWLAETLGKYVPPTGHPAVPDPEGGPIPNRRISNRRLTMELGCRLRHPTFRQGYTTEIKALTDAGLLEVPREDRSA